MSPADSARALLALPAAELPRSWDPAWGEPAPILEAMRAETIGYYQSDAERARTLAERACRVADRSGDLRAVGWSRRILAESRLFSGRFREAEQAYAVAADCWRRAGAGALLGQLLVGRIHVLSLLGRMTEVEAAARAARKHLVEAGDQAYLAKLAMNLGNLRFQREEYAAALAEYERAGAAFARLQIRDETVIGLDVNRAVALTQLDRDAEAVQAFDRLDRECGRRGLDLLRAQVRMNGAYVHFLRADFDRALRDLSPAAEYFRRTEHPAFLGSCLLNRAEIYQELNLAQEAAGLAREAAQQFEAAGLRDDLALALFQESLGKLALGEPALASLQRARRLFRREKSHSRVALLDLLEARLGRDRGAAAGRRAARLADRAREVFRRHGLIRWEAEAAVVWLEAERDRLTASRRTRLLQALLRRLPPHVYPLQASRLLEQLGVAQEAASRPTHAARSYERAAGQLERIRTHVPSEDSKIAFLGDKTHLYDRILRLELDRARPRPERLFPWMERARAQSLWDRLREPSATSAEKGEAAEERRRLSWLHARVSRLELGDAEDRRHAAELRTELRTAEARWSRLLRVRAETARPRSGGREEPDGSGAIPDPATVAAALRPGWGFLSYHLGSDFSLAVAITSTGLRFRRLAPDLRARVEGLADRLDFQWMAASMQAARRGAVPAEASREPAGAVVLDDRLRASTDAILRELYTELWEPLAEIGVDAGRKWVVSPHGPIHRIPLPALRGAGGYLAQETVISLTPSGQIWTRLPARPSPSSRERSWIAGCPSPELPAVEREVAAVAERLREWSTVTDLRPSREALVRLGRRSGLIHLAAHGSFRRDNPAYSFLELTDGPLFAHDLAGLRFPGSTVVLTACSSGRGAAPAGDEWIGLARGFLRAGASSVVASLWPIPDQPTAELMERFYESIARGEGVADSLTAAMGELIPHYPHPWNWSAFTVLGGAGARG